MVQRSGESAYRGFSCSAFPSYKYIIVLAAMDKWRSELQDDVVGTLSGGGAAKKLSGATPSGLLRDLLGGAVKHNQAQQGLEATAPSGVNDVAGIAELKALRAEVISLTKEIESLRSEKCVWLSRLQVDNRKLGQMFQDVEETKRRLIQEIDNIQIEKSRLKALQLSVSEDALDRLLQGSRLAPGSRKLLPVEKRTLAADVYDKLVKLVAQCKDNQVEVLKCVEKHAREVEGGFQDGTESGQTRMDMSLTALKNIASTLPGNLLAAEAVSASLSDAMVCALMEKSSVALARRADALEALGSDGAVEMLQAGGMSKISKQLASGASPDYKTLQTQFDAVNRALQEMRKRNTQLMAKAANDAKKEVVVKEIKATPESTNSRKYPPADVVLSNFEASSARVLQRDFDEFPEQTKQLASKMIAVHVLQTLKDNPLSVGLKEVILKETSAEIATHVSGLVGSALKAFRAHGEVDLQNSKSVETAVFRILSSPMCESRPFFLSSGEICAFFLTLLLLYVQKKNSH